MKIIRQGDVILVEVKSIPKEVTPVEATGSKMILAFGEATGHHHRFEFLNTDHNVKMFRGGTGIRYLDVSAPADLLHEEHSTARVGKGKWMLPQQVEYAPAELRRVAD